MPLETDGNAVGRYDGRGECRIARLIGYDGGMRFQFSTRQILLITAFVAIICGGTLAFRQTSKQWIRNGLAACLFDGQSLPWPYVAFYAAVPAPLWTPIVVVAYAIGRRSFTTRFVVIFAAIEVVAIFMSWGAWQLHMWFDGML